MTENKNEFNNVQTDKEVNLVDVLYILIKKWKHSVTFVFGVMLLTFLISLFLDKWYESTVVLMPPEASSNTFDLLSGNVGSLGSSILGIGNSGSERYVTILKSRKLREDFIKKYDLMVVFEEEYIEDLLNRLDQLIAIEMEKKTGAITLTFEFKNDPKKAAEMANYMVSKLDEINREMSTEQARSTRMFIERRYVQAMEDLKRSEDSLNSFQKKFGVIEITEQTTASIKAASEVYAAQITTEIELNVKKKTLGENHPEILNIQSKLTELRKAQINMEKGNGGIGVFIPFKRTPDLALEYFRLYRNIQINSKILEFLVPQFEQAKIQEAKDTPTLLILDEATPATKHVRPKKILLTLLSGVVAFAFMFVFTFLYQSISQSQRIRENSKMIYILEVLRIRSFFFK